MDNFDLYDAYEREQARQAKHRPKCECCGEPIWEDHAYRIVDMLICEECVSDRKVYIEEDDFYDF